MQLTTCRKDTAHLHNTWEPEARVEHISLQKMRNYQAKKINKTESDDVSKRRNVLIGRKTKMRTKMLCGRSGLELTES